MNHREFPARLFDLERLLGDPYSQDNPLGFQKVLLADEREIMLAAGEDQLDQFGLNAEFVPIEFGGSLTRMDNLIEIMRAVFRRDPALGLGYGASSLIAAANIWAAGDDRQKRLAASLLLNNKKIACSYYELPHGNDLTKVDFEAMPFDGRLILRGTKHVTTNAERAHAVVIFARTAKGPGSRCHSQIFILKSDIPHGQISYTKRFTSTGMRGVPLGGFTFDGYSLPVDHILGNPGRALEIAIRSFQVTRTAIPGMFLGILDTALRVTQHHTETRSLYGRAIAHLPLVRSLLATTFSDLLLCDCLSTVAARAVHLLPEEVSVYAPAVKYMLPGVMIGAMDRLTMVLGASFFRREGLSAIFQKLYRDLKPVGFGHVARVACQMTILPQLPRMARNSWIQTKGASSQVFQIGGPLPPLSFDNLGLGGTGLDRVMGSLCDVISIMDSGASAELQTILPLARLFLEELKRLKNECLKLSPSQLSVMASPEVYGLTERYAIVLCASAVLNIWWHNKGLSGTFIAKSDWVLAALSSLLARLGHEMPPINEGIEANLYAELVKRCANGRSLDLSDFELPSWSGSVQPTPQF